MASNMLVVVLSAFSIFVSFLFFLDGPADADVEPRVGVLLVLVLVDVCGVTIGEEFVSCAVVAWTISPEVEFVGVTVALVITWDSSSLLFELEQMSWRSRLCQSGCHSSLKMMNSREEQED